MQIPRRYKNAPAEFSVNLRLQALGRMIGSIYPSAWANIFNNKCLEISKSAFGELPTEWRLNIPPNGQMCNPIINDRIVNLLQKGEVNIVQTMSRILPSGDVELIDGKMISDTDTIILCTGYTYDYSLIPESISPVRDINRKWQASQASSNRPLHKLYRGLLSLDYPDSLAFLGVSGYPSSQMPLYDLISMAISQIWKGAYDLPSKEEMEAEVNERHAWLLELASKDSQSILPGRLKVGPWMEWLHDAAGTGVNERLGYGLSGWWYWITNFSSARKLMNGVNSPHIWRLFDGRRKKWDGAWEAIERVNQEARERQKGAIVKKTD
jgi:dimethylaniline monooxygenase (N-oxide forming)